ncbi:MAG: prepilin-type N-terminal cleavage/methylation domain-containing protein [Sedimentisphaerales bacterium]|jgi:prepilin-type N-terminal cleavage/methylation domain-containing protein
MKRKGQKGFTLIELIIAIITGTIVILAAGSILFFGNRYWSNAWKKTNLQRDASYAMFRISRSIQAGRSAELEDAGQGLRIYNEGGWMRFFVAPGASKLTLKSDVGGSIGTILEKNVEDLQFNVEGNKVTINLKLKQDNIQTHFASTVMMRNYYGG